MGDYPQFLPGTVKNPLENNLAGWMLLSSGKRATASSTLENRSLENAFDEDIRTVWSAQSGERGEWLQVDLGNVSDIRAVQINFAEQDAIAKARTEKTFQQYVLEASEDGKNWKTLVDKRRNERDAPHDYIELKKRASARYVKLTNFQTAGGAKFSVRDLRVFGRSNVAKPAEVKKIIVRRNPADARKAVIEWEPSPGTRGYTVRFGVSPEKLYGSYQIDKASPLVKGTSLIVNWLNKGADYYFSIDAFNESGITKGKIIVETKK
jgi:hypothetical protein